MAYSGIEEISCVAQNQVKVVKKKNLHFFGCLFMCMLTFACYNVSLTDSLGLKDFVQRVTASWTPKTEDIGKIKFVNFSFNENNNTDGVFMVSSPFKNYYVQNLSTTCLQVNGLGDMLVLSPIDGTVQDIIYSGGVYTISIVYGNVLVKLGGVDYACTSVGATVSSGDKIAVSLKSLITFEIVCDGKPVDLYSGGAADTFFE